MSQVYFDVLVAKDYESNQNGNVEKRTAWNKVGVAWPSKSGSSMLIELFMLPDQKYIVQFQNNKEKPNE